MRSFIVLNLILVVSTSALAGPGASRIANPGGGMRHDAFAEQMRRQQQKEVDRRNREAKDRQRREEAAREQQKVAEEARRAKEEQDRREAENTRIEKERKAAQEEADRKARELNERRQQIRNNQNNGTLNTSNVTANEMVDMFNNKKDQQLKETWATMIIIMHPNDQRAIDEARDFLVQVRSWTTEEVENLAIAQQDQSQ